MNSKKVSRNPLLWLLVALPLVYLLSLVLFQSDTDVETSEGFELLRGETVEHVLIDDVAQRVTLTLTEPYEDHGEEVHFYFAEAQADQLVTLVNAASEREGFESFDTDVPQPSFWASMLAFMLPLFVILAIFYFLFWRNQSGGPMRRFGKSRATMVSKETPQTTFADVAGADEAVEELHEIKEFLAEPDKFHAVGAKIPKGVLLVGPPGTGKTLLARAVAGEAGAPFFALSGSDFVEMYVGVGASRVRDLFEKAKENAPAIIFIDEIDAVGRRRGAGMGGGHDEREQTLNQLLVAMDGFEANTNVILIAATNRPDILDPALLRPGRFDRQVTVESPDLKGRLAILQVHARGKPMVPEVNLETIARRTPGFSGADLANVLNEAALLTARSGAQLIDDRALDEAIDRVLAGPQKRTRLMNEKERKITAYHEGGHALTAAALRYTDPVTKVTIAPRGRALGYTMVMPVEDRYSTTRNELLDQLVYAMGGRVAEELVFHDPSTGASNDIEKATGIARKMVTQYGMSDRIGAIKLGQDSGEVFMGRDMGHQRDYSEGSAAIVDEEVRKLIDAAHDEAWEILNEYRDVLDELVLALLDRETLNEAELRTVFAPVVKRDPRPVWLSSSARAVSNRPPVLTDAERAAGEQIPPQDQAAAAGEGPNVPIPPHGPTAGGPPPGGAGAPQPPAQGSTMQDSATQSTAQEPGPAGEEPAADGQAPGV